MFKIGSYDLIFGHTTEERETLSTSTLWTLFYDDADVQSGITSKYFFNFSWKLYVEETTSWNLERNLELNGKEREIEECSRDPGSGVCLGSGKEVVLLCVIYPLLDYHLHRCLIPQTCEARKFRGSEGDRDSFRQVPVAENPQYFADMARSITGVSLGFLVGAIPTISMTIASVVLTSITVTVLVEAAFQNFAAGLIIAAGHNSHIFLWLVIEAHTPTF